MDATSPQFVNCLVVWNESRQMIPSCVTCVDLDLKLRSIEILFDLFTIAPVAFGRVVRRLLGGPDRRAVKLGMIFLNGRLGADSQTWQILDFSKTVGFEEVWHVSDPVGHEKCAEARERILTLMHIRETNMVMEISTVSHEGSDELFNVHCSFPTMADRPVISFLCRRV